MTFDIIMFFIYFPFCMCKKKYIDILIHSHITWQFINSAKLGRGLTAMSSIWNYLEMIAMWDIHSLRGWHRPTDIAIRSPSQLELLAKVCEDSTITMKAPTRTYSLSPVEHSVLNVKAQVAAFNLETALVGAFSVIVKSSRTFVCSSKAQPI